MSWVTLLWSMDAALCFTLAGICLLVWSRQRQGWVHLLFSCSAVAAGVIAMLELTSMRAETTAQYGALLRWAHLPVWMLIVSLVCFVRLYLRAGRPWLAWSICGLRTVALVLNFIFTPNLQPAAPLVVGRRNGLGAGRRAEPLDFGRPTKCDVAPHLFRGCHHHCLAAW